MMGKIKNKYFRSIGESIEVLVKTTRSVFIVLWLFVLLLISIVLFDFYIIAILLNKKLNPS